MNHIKKMYEDIPPSFFNCFPTEFETYFIDSPLNLVEDCITMLNDIDMYDEEDVELIHVEVAIMLRKQENYKQTDDFYKAFVKHDNPFEQFAAAALVAIKQYCEEIRSKIDARYNADETTDGEDLG